MTVPIAQQSSAPPKNLRVRIEMRVKLPNGSRACVDPVFASNGTLKPFVALVGGKPTHHPEAVYHLRYVRAGKRVWEPVGTDSQQGAHREDAYGASSARDRDGPRRA